MCVCVCVCVILCVCAYHAYVRGSRVFQFSMRTPALITNVIQHVQDKCVCGGVSKSMCVCVCVPLHMRVCVCVCLLLLCHTHCLCSLIFQSSFLSKVSSSLYTVNTHLLIKRRKREFLQFSLLLTDLLNKKSQTEKQGTNQYINQKLSTLCCM